MSSSARRINPENPQVYENRGTVYYNTGFFSAALEDYNTVVKLAPRDETAYRGRALIYNTLAEHEGNAALRESDRQKAREDEETARRLTEETEKYPPPLINRVSRTGQLAK
jgi:regulator of sirC expression with transglutaminase-like and TPR domain